MAVALDGGIMLTERRHAQATADAAALAAAADLLNHYMANAGVDSGTAVTSATTLATANGYTGANSTVTVRVYPASYQGGPNAGTQVPAGYAEVTVTYNQARFFSSMWGSSSIPISARAVARGKWDASDPAILALNPTADGALTATGNGSISVTRTVEATGTGNIIVDSSSSAGITVSGKNAVVTDPSGGIDVSGPAPGFSGSGSVSPAPTTNQPTTPDPLRFIPEPSQPAAAPSSTTSNGVTTYYPGYYPSGLSLTAGYTAVLQPGLYYMGGTFKVNGNGSSSLTGSGVTIFAGTGGSLDLGGNGSVTLSPQTSGIYQGLLYFQSRSNTSDVNISGSGSFNVTGTIYAPKATLTVTGNGDSVSSQIIADQVQNKGSGSGNGSVGVVYNRSNVAKTRILNLVE
jgi:hypothetical protein